MKNQQLFVNLRHPLREKAEALVKNKSFSPEHKFSQEEIISFLHEIEVQQIELEIQNEELKIAKELADNSLL
jgi:hypothetical protein